MTFNMKEPTLRNNIDEFKPIFKSWNEVSQKVSTTYGTNSLGEMAFWLDESWSLYLHNIYTTNHCGKSWSMLASSYRNLPFLPAASRNPGHVMEQIGFQHYRTRIGICIQVSYQQQAGIQGTKLLSCHHRCCDSSNHSPSSLRVEISHCQL